MIKLKTLDAAELRQFLVTHRELTAKGEQWLETVPREMVSIFYDNPYHESKEELLLLTMKMILGDFCTDVFWFLYEWKPSDGCIQTGDVSYNIHTVDDFIAYLVAEGIINE